MAFISLGQKTTRTHKLMKRMMIIAGLVVTCFSVSACGSNPIVGTYVGTSDSSFVINDDGTLQYTQESWDGEWSDGSWATKSDGTYSFLIDRIDYGLVAEIGEDGKLIVEGDGSSESERWNTEFFTKE